MSDSDSDDFFYNQNLSDSYDEAAMGEGEDLINTSTFKSKTFAVKREIDSSPEFSENERTEVLKKQKFVTNDSFKSDVDSSDSEEPIILISDSSDDRSATSPIDLIKSGTIEEHKEEPEQDQTLDFLSEVVYKAKVFKKEHISEASSIRIYNVNFISEVEGSKNRKVNVKVKGKKSFETILPVVVDTFIKTYKIKKSLQKLYKPMDLVMFRNGIEVLPFSNCDSMRISHLQDLEQIQVEIVIVHISMCKEYKDNYERNRISRLESLEASNLKDDGYSKDFSSISKFEDFEKELVDAPKITNLDMDLEFEENGKSQQPMRIVLIDKNNSKVPIDVKPQRTFVEVIETYRKIKNISNSVEIKLYFDHSEIDPSAKISSEELEEGDIIEVDFNPHVI